MNNVNKGNAMTHATTLGTTRSLKESIDRDSMASICSVTRILASTAPIPDPTRPASRRPATSGPISTKKESAWTVGDHSASAKGHQSTTGMKGHHRAEREARGHHERQGFVTRFDDVV